MEFRVLGPVEVVLAGRSVSVLRRRERCLLTLLALDVGRPVPVDRLLDLLWDGEPPASARSVLYTCVSRLRAALPGIPLVRCADGYMLSANPGAVDAHCFSELVESARTAEDPASRSRLLGEALGLWRGPVAADADSSRLRSRMAHLEELQRTALHLRIEADLVLGRHAELVCELAELTARSPLDERLAGLLMLALYRSDRRPDALAAFQSIRRRLADELGLDPSSDLRALHQGILRSDPALERSAGSPTAVPAQLPADVPDFIGRDADLSLLSKLLDEASARLSRAVVISAIAGTAGVGKTALAVHFSHRVRDRFADGQLYVNLRGSSSGSPVRPIEALGWFLRALGVPPEQIPLDVDEAAGLYRSLLADKRVLVLLDNAASAEQVRPLVPGGAGCLLLVTSRDRLAGLIAKQGAVRLALDMLPHREAVALLERIVGVDRCSAEPAAVDALARVCGGLPLALRIAAAHLADDPHQSVASYVSRLAGGSIELEVAGDGEASLRAAFFATYGRLEAPVQRLFRLLGIAPGPDITPVAVAALGSTTQETAIQHLGRLLEVHLVVRPEPGRYAMHDLLRRYAAERSAAEDRATDRHEAVRNLLAWYLHTAAAARGQYTHFRRVPLPPAPAGMPVPDFVDHVSALAWFDAERSNLLAAVLHASEHGPRHVAWQLAEVVRGYLGLRRYLLDWLTVADAGLAAATAEGATTARIAALNTLAIANRWAGSNFRSIELHRKALALAQHVGSNEEVAASLGHLGRLYWELGRPQVAADHLVRALAVERTAGRRPSEGVHLTYLGLVYLELGSVALAADCSQQALVIAMESDSRASEAAALQNLGLILHARGRLDDALDHLNRALAMQREVGDRCCEARAMDGIARVHRDASRLGDALDVANAALTLARAIADKRTVAQVLVTLATIHQRCSDRPKALEYAREAHALAENVGFKELAGQAMGIIEAQGAIQSAG